MIKVALEAKIKENEEEIRRKDDEMKVALKKQVRFFLLFSRFSRLVFWGSYL